MTINRRRYVACPCGSLLEGSDDDDLVLEVQRHLSESHPGLHYGPEQILMMAY